MTLKADRFIAANAKSPVVYGSCDADGCTYRLADGSRWQLNRNDCQAVGHPRWAHGVDA
jgi:hypothetical protein